MSWLVHYGIATSHIGTRIVCREKLRASTQRLVVTKKLSMPQFSYATIQLSRDTLFFKLDHIICIKMPKMDNKEHVRHVGHPTQLDT